jgi:hypothetical protein
MGTTNAFDVPFPGVKETACIASLIRSDIEASQARLMIESLRTFGGSLQSTPVWVFALTPERFERELKQLDGVDLIQLKDQDTIPDYLFATKVYACAQAEELAASGMRSLIWLNPQSLTIQPPLLISLSHNFQAALRPVHICNVGSLAKEPLDIFWHLIYNEVGLKDASFTVESFLDMREIRPYFNTHLFAVNPKQGLMRSWMEAFILLVSNPDFQAQACGDDLHKIFLHQAVLSALVVKKLRQEEICQLPPGYSYPLHLHNQAQSGLRIDALDDMILPVYEDEESHPLVVKGLRIGAELRTWLEKHVSV